MPIAPVWRARVALGYLTVHPTRAATEAMIRYAFTTPIPMLQAAAARAVAAARDPTLARKPAVERDRLARAGQSLPAALSALVT